MRLVLVQVALVQCGVLQAVAEVALAQDVPSKIKQEVRRMPCI